MVLLLGGLTAVYLFFVTDRPPKTMFGHQIEIKDLGEVEGQGAHKYLVEYNYSISNRGVFSSDVTYVIISVFLGDLGKLDQNVAVINSHYSDGVVPWTLLETVGYRSQRYWKPFYESEYTGERVEFVRNRGGTGELASQETSHGSMALLLRAEPGKSIVAFEVRFGIDGGFEPKNRWRFRKAAILARDVLDGTSSVVEVN